MARQTSNAFRGSAPTENQQVNLKIKGLYTAPNDFTGVPDGALDVADNIVIDQESLAEPRRGFALTAILPETSDRVQSFVGYQGVRVLAYGADKLAYDAGAGPVDYEGTYPPPDPDRARVRFFEANQNLYISTANGIYKLDRYDGTISRAGVPRGLDLQLVLSGSSGFFQTNVVTTITGKTLSGSANLTLLSDIAGVSERQYIQGAGIPLGTTVSSITPSAVVLITTATLTAGNAAITVASSAGLLANQLVQGTGIPDDTRILTVVGTTVTLTNLAIASGTGVAVTFSTDPIITMSANATASASNVTLAFSDGAQVAYRLVWGIRDANDNVILSAPSQFATITNATGSTSNVIASSSIPDGITINHFYQLYRSNQTAAADVTPQDDMQLVYEGNPLQADIDAGFISVSDLTPDSLRGESLYTSVSQQGIGQANEPPPLCKDACTFRGYTLYANTTSKHRLNLTILAVGSPGGLQSGDVLTIAATAYTAAGTEDFAVGQFKVFSGGTPAQNIADTANSLIKVINRYATNTAVYAYLLSGPTDLPGQILVEEMGNGGAAFAVVASAHSTAYNPSLPPSGVSVSSKQSVNKNGIIVSKPGTPEAAPGINLFFAGSASKAILRIIPLRDYVVILKEDGIYRLSGNTLTSFTVSPFDLTTKLIAPETAVSLTNEVWGLFDQGVCSVSDTGVNLRSRSIDDIINNLITTALPTLERKAFGIAYETDRKYILALPGALGDEACIQQYVFPTFTNAWSRWTRRCTAGFVDPAINKLFIGNSSNSISEERKTNSHRDYVDEAFPINIVSSSGYEVVVDDILNISPGDVLYSGATVACPIEAIDVATKTLTVQDFLIWANGAASIFPAIESVIQWKPVVAGNPSYVRQYPEGSVLFKRTKFNKATLAFYSDVQQSFQEVPLTGPSLGTWGTFRWGSQNWGGVNRPKGVRFIVPADMQMASQLSTKITIRSGYSNWALEGIAMAVNSASQEIAI